MESRYFYGRSEANTIVDLLIFCYEDMINVVIEDYSNGSIFPEKTNYLANLMETIITYINQFDINWRDTIETMTVMETTMQVLSISRLATNVSMFLI